MLRTLRRELLLGLVGFTLGAVPLLAAHGAGAQPPAPARPTSILAAAG